MSHNTYVWPSWTQEELSTAGAGPSGSQSNNAEQELNVIPAGAYVARNRGGRHVSQDIAGYSQPYDARLRFRSCEAGSLLPVMSAHPDPSFFTSPFPFPATIPFALPTWASTSTPVLALHLQVPHARALTPTSVPDVQKGSLSPSPEGLPSPVIPAAPLNTAAPVTPAVPDIVILTATPAVPTTPVVPATDVIPMERVTPTNAQRSKYCALEGAVRPLTGPWVDMARTVIDARLDPRWDPSVFRRETRKRGDAQEQPSPKRARVEEGLGEAAAGVRAEGAVSADEGENGKMKAKELDSGAGSEKSEGAWSMESRFRPIAPMPSPGPVHAAGGLHPILVVVPQVNGNALTQHNDTSTTSTHRVDNPAGEFVVEPVPLPSGGPSTSTPADDQDEAGEPDDHDQDGHQHQLGDDSSPSKREAAVVIDEKIYGGDPLRCLACNNKSFARKYDRRRHVVTVHYLGKIPCDWCDLFFYARRDGVTRHKDENSVGGGETGLDRRRWRAEAGGMIIRSLASVLLDLLELTGGGGVTVLSTLVSLFPSIIFLNNPELNKYPQNPCALNKIELYLTFPAHRSSPSEGKCGSTVPHSYANRHQTRPCFPTPQFCNVRARPIEYLYRSVKLFLAGGTSLDTEREEDSAYRWLVCGTQLINGAMSSGGVPEKGRGQPNQKIVSGSGDPAASMSSCVQEFDKRQHPATQLGSLTIARAGGPVVVRDNAMVSPGCLASCIAEAAQLSKEEIANRTVPANIVQVSRGDDRGLNTLFRAEDYDMEVAKARMGTQASEREKMKVNTWGAREVTGLSRSDGWEEDDLEQRIHRWHRDIVHNLDMKLGCPVNRRGSGLSLEQRLRLCASNDGTMWTQYSNDQSEVQAGTVRMTRYDA
ncbi:hypothetical protein HETIRDRAFT_426011 [Heterobasidion irregulare TC 32-1]|uniref:Uncharacterized protein n=1 Tax=Heterobasidion irregulare (strain TC 32-1) TaxID=747525 RepID=W4KGJ2_HETIT|nr:uncharacterized protein HETIRDRAFT_426011 [Heterobasidion irregulare TC 32-1]ETW84819.1 hypothetical protein HETIRDRAFT_426011 [Heterobasidion irregulare TC 32-1]